MSGTTDHDDWVIPPPEPGTVAFVFRAGADLELSPAAVEALETLARELGDNDVAGFAMDACNGKRRCEPLTVGQCYLYSSCRIVGG